MADLRVDFDYVIFDETDGRNFTRTSVIQFALYMIPITAAAIFVSVCYWYFSVNVRGLSRYDSLSNACGVFLVALPTIWFLYFYYSSHKGYEGDYGRVVTMESRRSLILSGDYIRLTDNLDYVDYHVSQLKRIKEKETNFTLEFRKAPDILIVKSKVVEGDLSELVAQLKSHLK